MAGGSSGRAPAVLVIGVADAAGAGGIQHALTIIQGMGLRGVSCITGVTWQGASGPRIARLPLPVISGQIDAVYGQVGACLVGAMPSPEIVRCVMERLRRRNVPAIVIHPIAGGDEQPSQRSIDRLKSYFSMAACVVSDLDRARVFLPQRICPPTDTGAAARILVEGGIRCALVLAGKADAEDTIYDGVHERRQPAAAGPAVAAARVACWLARGETPFTAGCRALDPGGWDAPRQSDAESSE